MGSPLVPPGSRVREGVDTLPLGDPSSPPLYSAQHHKALSQESCGLQPAPDFLGSGLHLQASQEHTVLFAQTILTQTLPPLKLGTKCIQAASLARDNRPSINGSPLSEPEEPGPKPLIPNISCMALGKSFLSEDLPWTKTAWSWPYSPTGRRSPT